MLNRKFSAVIGSVLVAALLMACSVAGTSQAQEFTDEMAARIDAVAEDMMTNGYYPGVAISVTRDGETLYAQGYGTANIEYEYPVTSETVFPIGSVTKSFTALSAAQLIVAGEIGLDDPITDYIEDLPEGWDAIHVRNLMNHTSGIFNYTNDRSVHANQDRHYTHAGMRAFFEDHPLAFEPGSQFSYTNSGTYLLGMIIENVSGMTYGEYLQEHIFTPFGMEHTSLADFTTIIPGRAAGYQMGENGFENAGQFSPTIPFSAGAIISTVGDLALYGEAVHQSDLVSDEVREILYTRDILANGEPLDYALGSLLVQEVNGRDKISHSGDIFGFSSHFAHYPEENITISVLANNQGGLIHPASVERRVARIVFGEDDPEIVANELTEEEIESFTGDYSTWPLNFFTDRIALVANEGQMQLVFGGSENPMFGLPLLYQGEGHFVVAFDHEVTVTVDTSSDPATALDLVMYDGLMTGHRIEE